MDFATRHLLKDRIRQIAAPVIEREGYELVAVEFTGSGRGTTLQLFVDRPGGIDIGACAALSRAVSPALDVEDPIPGTYQLEVSSPGIDRPLQKREDFARFSGYRAKIRMAPHAPRKNYAGRLQGVEGDQILIEVDGQAHRLFHDDIDKAHLVLDLDEYKRLAEPLSAPPGGTP